MSHFIKWESEIYVLGSEYSSGKFTVIKFIIIRPVAIIYTYID